MLHSVVQVAYVNVVYALACGAQQHLLAATLAQQPMLQQCNPTCDIGCI
jgi:hypothetical protein